MGPTSRRQVVTYLLVALVSMALDVTTVLLARRALALPLVLAVSAGLAANVLAGFVLQRLVVFRITWRPLHQSGWRYLVLVGLNVGVAVGGVSVVVARGVPYLVARPLSSALLVVVNFVAMRQWVFPAGSTAQVP